MILTGEQNWTPNFSLPGYGLDMTVSLSITIHFLRCYLSDSSTEIFTTGQLTSALMEHIQKATLEMKKEVKTGEAQNF